ncbi:MAG: 16S rRNA (guanine(527)-N(7))-methyltransferase RsmG [Flavobacteriales bacterium]|jgi:16S rRNA (guanine527-N7)-methyltransferase|nr:16S rRNA (guanine(527)-N(7))-methyltransferase RsmG [Flavobacteriaceae bacterium]MBT5150822.1 16S rRNA (guanine(527)-N(7))-methyltransferase RsmG [Flavobacteriales bacterium]MDA8994594.1 16S rRNA (guanine(527)-N(7))-methyltransferase RsmG [Schleiferiaceae bacterium]MDP4617179.1 16S rRNA (guanine(527)-N(7))-methyltransferase RsmG [Schleiferiaceae bacterium]MDP4759833.1 16S rRNA (guanine(527)-N(7))-methyltransferase RsmG [Schleiferiaceae bacterium]
MQTVELIYSHFPDLTERQRDQFAALHDLYTEWNAKINVISRKDMESFYEKHVLHSLGIAKVYSFQPGQKVLDVGTGGGFPGIPLAILFPETQFHLVDSIGKKIKVVLAVAEALGLENVRADHGRAEEFKGPYDFVVSRAVTQMQRFVPWIKGKISQKNLDPERVNGLLYLKGGDLAEELGTMKARISNLSNVFTSEFFETKKVVYLPKSEINQFRG